MGPYGLVRACPSGYNNGGCLIQTNGQPPKRLYNQQIPCGHAEAA